METVRLRLLFEDRSILSKSQRKQGLKRSWILLKPQHQTISDLSSYLLYIFQISETCPHGIILSMDGFVLPPFESTCIFKDKDIISVKKKGGKSTEIIKAGNGFNSLEELEIVEQPPVNAAVKVLASEEFNKESGGYESGPEEDEQELEPLENHAQVESTPIKKMVSKKRKARDKLPSSRRKKSKLAGAEKSPVSENGGVDVHPKKSKSSRQLTALPKEKVVEKDKSVDMQGEPEKPSSPAIDGSSDDETHERRFSQLPKTDKGSVDVSQRTGDAKKLPSRSARRKKAKRRWLREQAKIENEKLHSEQLLGKDNKQLAANDNLKISEEHLPPVNDSDVENNVVPIVVRPGHIRFEALEKEVAEQAVQKSPISVFGHGQKNFQWNGITSKKKGQKWGKEKTPPLKRNDDKSFSQMSSEMVAVEKQATVTYDMDFSELMPYSSLPKDGDLVAYRMVELSSSWTPELCSFRVGKISHYDVESNRIILTLVPEYLNPSEKKINEDASELPDTSLYGEDGSLEIDYSSLVDVRLVKRGNSDAIRAVAKGSNENCAQDQDVLTSRQPNGCKEAALVSAAPPTQVNAWEEISQALSAKKAELSKEDGWSQTDSPGRGSWSYRALRCSALGPTMAFLRAQNEI